MKEGGLLVGCDFSSCPNRRKPIVMALGRGREERVRLEAFEQLDSLEGFAEWLVQPRSWIGGFDFPFGLPRELVEQLGWPRDWASSIRHFAGLSRPEIRATFAAFCAARPPGGKFAHRRCDSSAGSSPSMKWVNPPVAYMLHAGAASLLASGVHLPGLHRGDEARVALEAYPGLFARELIGRRSYKNDDPAKQTAEREAAREKLVEALQEGRSRLQLRLELSPELRDAMLEDASGDHLDAVLCLMQAAWGARQGPPVYGLPPDLDPLEGWIVTA